MEILMTDLTYMKGGVCIAGINYETCKNIRPVLRYGQIQRAYIEENNIYPAALVSFDIKQKKDSSPPHIEDYIFDIEKTEFIRYLSQSEWQERLQMCANASILNAFNNCIVDNKGIPPNTETCSLALIKLKSNNIKINFYDNDISAMLPFKTRLSFVCDGERFQ